MNSVLKSEKSINLSEFIHQITYHSKDRKKLLKSVDPKKQAQVIIRLSQRVQIQLLTNLNNEEILPFIEHLDPDEVTHLLRNLPKNRQEVLINQLSEYYKKSVSELLKFDPKTAAGLMNLNYIQVNYDAKVIEVVEQIKTSEKRTGKLPTILVMKDGKLTGNLSFSAIALADKNQAVGEFSKTIPTIKHSSEYGRVIKLFKDETYNKIVVLSENDSVIGIIYAEDILNLIGEQSSLSLYSFAGVSQEETFFDSASKKIRFRYKWLIINLATAFLASFVVRNFESTIAKNVLLAVYMPIIAGMGGNAGTQTLAVMIRSLADNDINLKMILETLKNEILSGATNGLINGMIVGIVVWFLNHDLIIALILAIAMVVNLIVASTFGTIVPFIMKKIGKDPASSATIFITTATDVFGFMTFLSLAKILIK